MITVHHLQNSRSIRILWLLEELGLPYEIVHHQRRDHMFAPDEYRRVHPLGKAPAITDGDRVIAESGAIIEYILEVHGNGRMRPQTGSDDWVRYLQWMHLIEGSVMLPYILSIYIEMLGEGGAPIKGRADSENALHFGFLESEMTGRAFVVGDGLTGADIQLTFLLDGAQGRGMLAEYPELARYHSGMIARPAYQRALEIGGSYNLSDLRKGWNG